MSLVQTSPPAIEPVTLAETKAHLRVDTTADDAVIGALITTARLQVEAALSLALITQAWTYSHAAWRDTRMPVTIPLGPIREVLSIRHRAPDGTLVTLPLNEFIIDGNARPPRIGHTGASPPALSRSRSDTIEIAFVAGFGDTAMDVPAPLRHAVNLLTAHWYEHRDRIDGSSSPSLPDQITALLAPWQPMRLA